MRTLYGSFTSAICGLIHAGVAESSSDAERALYTRARADQLLNIWLLVPLYFLFNAGCAIALSIWGASSSTAAATFG